MSARIRSGLAHADPVLAEGARQRTSPRVRQQVVPQPEQQVLIDIIVGGLSATNIVAEAVKKSSKVFSYDQV